MHKYIILLAFITINSLANAQQRDYIVTLSGDTVYGKIADSPKKAGAKHIRGKQYLYDYIIIDFTPDSQMVYPPSKIKAYGKFWKKKDGTPLNYIMNSDSVSFEWRAWFHSTRKTYKEPKFVRSLIKGGYYNFYHFVDWCSDGGDHYFILEEKATKNRTSFYSTRKLRKLLSDWPDANKKIKRYRNWFKGKQYLVIDYNRFKAKK